LAPPHRPAIPIERADDRGLDARGRDPVGSRREQRCEARQRGLGRRRWNGGRRRRSFVFGRLFGRVVFIIIIIIFFFFFLVLPSDLRNQRRAIFRQGREVEEEVVVVQRRIRIRCLPPGEPSFFLLFSSFSFSFFRRHHLEKRHALLFAQSGEHSLLRRSVRGPGVLPVELAEPSGSLNRQSDAQVLEREGEVFNVAFVEVAVKVEVVVFFTTGTLFSFLFLFLVLIIITQRHLPGKRRHQRLLRV